MYNFTVPMGLMDFVPVAFWAITAVLLLKDLHRRLSLLGYTLLAAGTVNVFLAGFCKALWKLLYAANICDFVALEKMFMPVNSIGLLLAGIALILLVIPSRRKALLSVAPVPFASSMPFIVIMTLGLGGMCTALSILAARKKQWLVMLLFILSFLCAMGMGALSSQDMSLAWVNWTEQGINALSQLCLMLGVIFLRKKGL